jgi:hypothetical protein
VSEKGEAMSEQPDKVGEQPSEWRERAERAEAGRDEARALALELGAAVFVCPEHGVDGQPRCPVCAALARVRALADNESRNDG